MCWTCLLYTSIFLNEVFQLWVCAGMVHIICNLLMERTVIDRCVRQMYREHLQNPETAEMPTLQTLYDLLCACLLYTSRCV